MGFVKWIIISLLKTIDFFLYFLIFAGVVNILTNPKDFFYWCLTILCIGYILLNRFLIKKIDQSKKAKKRVVISSSANLSRKDKLQQMKDAGIKKVELLCIDNCDCCKEFKDKQIPIDNAFNLPREDCPLEQCRGIYTAVVEFDLS